MTITPQCTGREKPTHRLVSVEEIENLTSQVEMLLDTTNALIDERDSLRGQLQRAEETIHAQRKALEYEGSVDRVRNAHYRAITLEQQLADARAIREADLDRIVEMVGGADSYRDEEGMDLQTISINYPVAARERVREILEMTTENRQRLHRVGECWHCYETGAGACGACFRHGLHGCDCSAPSEEDARSAWGDQEYDRQRDEGRV